MNKKNLSQSSFTKLALNGVVILVFALRLKKIHGCDKMNDKIIKCNMCFNEMKEYEGNNPQPLLPDFNDRVCKECNYFVTAARMQLSSYHQHELEHICNLFTKIVRKAAMIKQFSEMVVIYTEEE
jgi:hypothetical protein